jgi:hypothetical protein
MALLPFRLLIQMFYCPGIAFGALKKAPQSWFPLLALAAGIAAIQFWYFQTVDSAWLLAHEMAGRPESAKAGAAPEAGISAAVLMWTVLVISVVSVPAVCAVNALYLTIASKVSGFPRKFSDWFVFSAWTSVPNLLLLPLMAFQIISSGGQIALEELSLASLNALLFHLPYTHPWAGLAAYIDLALIWSVVLTATGLKIWTGCRPITCLILALIPVVLVSSVWAVSIVVFG